MRLLTYTRYLWRKIKFYDRLAIKVNSFLRNPFDVQDRAITVLWVEDENIKAFHDF